MKLFKFILALALTLNIANASNIDTTNSISKTIKNTTNTNENNILLPLPLNGKWGFVNKDGKFVIAPIFDDVDSFKEGLAAVELNGGGYNFIDKTGKFAMKPIFDLAFGFNRRYSYGTTIW